MSPRTPALIISSARIRLARLVTEGFVRPLPSDPATEGGLGGAEPSSNVTTSSDSGRITATRKAVQPLLAGECDVALADVGERECEFEGAAYDPEFSLARDHALWSNKRHHTDTVEEEIVGEQIMGG